MLVTNLLKSCLKQGASKYFSTAKPISLKKGQISQVNHSLI